MLLVNQVENQDVKVKIIDAYRKTEKRDREKILKRKNIIENRKEELEVISREKVIISELVSFMSVYPVDLVWVFQSSKRIAEYSIIIYKSYVLPGSIMQDVWLVVDVWSGVLI